MKLNRARTVAQEKPELRRELNILFDRIEKTPRTHTCKGMFVSGLFQALETMGCDVQEREKVTPFKDYPLQDYMELLLDGAVTLYPGKPAQQGLRSLGQLGIPTFARSIVGGVIMGTVGRSWELALKCVSRGYEVSLKPGKAIVAEMTSNRALLQLRNVWNFGESYQVGMIEGLMQWCDLNGTVTAHTKSPCDVDLKIEWESAAAARGASKANRTSNRAATPG